jgi:hypothetical protein
MTEMTGCCLSAESFSRLLTITTDIRIDDREKVFNQTQLSILEQLKPWTEPQVKQSLLRTFFY